MWPGLFIVLLLWLTFSLHRHFAILYVGNHLVAIESYQILKIANSIQRNRIRSPTRQPPPPPSHNRIGMLAIWFVEIPENPLNLIENGYNNCVRVYVCVCDVSELYASCCIIEFVRIAS